MAISKSPATLLSAVTTSQTSSAQDCSGDYGQKVFGKIVVVGTPTVGAMVQVNFSPDGGTTYFSPLVLSFTAPLVAGTYDFMIEVPVEANKVTVTFTVQTGGTSSTATVILGQVTAL